jgi:hypothetical protein
MKYNYQINWSEEDQLFIATCNRFPNLSYSSEYEEEALKGIKNLVIEQFADEDLLPEAEDKTKLWELVSKFINENQIYCEETIYQTDWVIEHAYSFIEDCCEIVGYKK